MNTLIWAGIRQHRGSLIGVFIAIFCAALLVTGLGVLVESGLRGGVTAERYSAADVVVAGNQELTGLENLGVSLPERTALPADIDTALSEIPGVDRIVADTTTPLSWGTSAVEAHGWSAAALTPYEISNGHAPEAKNEVVVDAALASRTKVGDTITLGNGGINAEYTVVGIASATGSAQPTRAQHVFVSDATASALAGHAGTPTVLGVFATNGVSAIDLASQIRQSISGTSTFVGSTRGDIEFLDSGAARNTLVALGSSFAGTALLIAIFVVAGTLSLSIQSRRRDFALLRAIGATPKQIHRLVAKEVLIVASMAAVIGSIPGYLLADALRFGFSQGGIIPSDFALSYSAMPAIIAIIVVVCSALVAAWSAARRPARINPVEALHEASITPSRMSVGRTITGLVLAVGGLAASATPLFLGGTAALAGPAGAALMLIIAVALLGPQLVRGAVNIFGGPLRRSSSPSAFLAATNARSNSRRLAAAIIPLALGIGLGLVQVGTPSIVAAEAATQSQDGVIADLMVTGGPTGLSAEAVASIASTAGVKAANPVALSQAILKYDEFGDPAAEAYAIQGIDPNALASTMDLDVAEGSLDQLTEIDTVALSTDVAQTTGVRVGDTVNIVLGDGTASTSRLVATYARGLGFGEVTVANDVLSAHTTSGLNAYVLVDAEQGQEEHVQEVLAASGFTVVNQGELLAAGDTARNANSLVNLIALFVILGYIAITVANTLIMATGERRREFALLQLVGSTRRQVRGMMRMESVMVVVIAAVLGTFVAIPPLIGISLGVSGQPIPNVSPVASLLIVGSLSALGLLSLAAGTRSAMRSAPINEIGSRE